MALCSWWATVVVVASRAPPPAAEHPLLSLSAPVQAAEGLNKGKKGKGGGVVQAQNGEGDSLSLSSGILQVGTGPYLAAISA